MRLIGYGQEGGGGSDSAKRLERTNAINRRGLGGEKEARGVGVLDQRLYGRKGMSPLLI